MTDLSVGSMLVEDRGAGEAVIMVHGLGGTSNTFQTLMPHLESWRVLRPDLPGAGRSALRPGLSGIDGLASSLREVMQAASVHQAHFIAHSMGTLICQHLAVSHPDLVSSMVLFGPMLEPPAAARSALLDRAQSAMANGMTEIAEAISMASVSATSRASNPVAPAFVRESLMHQSPAGYATHCEFLAAAGAADHSAIQCPVLLVAGEQDPVTPVAMARTLNGAIKGSTLEIIAGVGHWMTIEAPKESAELARKHLDAMT